MNLTPLSSRKPYDGNTRKLVIAFDVGTTFSGASFAKLEPGLPPNIQGVTRFPAQHKVGGNSKIPSIIYYDSHGVVKAVGAEAVEEGFIETAQDEGYTKVEWFKLHLRPKSLSAQIADSDLPPLPKGKSAIDIFSDFLKYLFHCTRQYIVEMNYNGESYWTSVKDNIDFVLTHPNGWEGRQQSLMRRAAVKAGLVDAKSAQARVQFVTEGEASLHFCLTAGKLDEIKNQTNEGMIIVDAGGGTIDLSAYRKASGGDSGGWSFEEVAPIQCCMQGSIFVTRRARAYLHSRLSNTRFGNPEDVQHISEVFDATTKLGFRDSSAPYYIRFGGMRDTERIVDIRNGQMKLAGDVIAQFFNPSITAVVDAVQSQQKSANIPIKTVMLVGGYAASDWLFSNLCAELAKKGCTVFRPDGHLNKAVADGAVSYYLDHRVGVRTTRFSYGVEGEIRYLPQLTDHKSREHLVYESADGVACLPGHYYEILAKGTSVKEESEFRQNFSRMFVNINKKLRNTKDVILCFKGNGEPPSWISDDETSFSELCAVKSNLLTLARQSKQKFNKVTNISYYEIEFDVILLLGMTEMKAQVAWIENGVEKRSRATIVYNDE